MLQQLPGNASEMRRAYKGHMAQPQSAPLTGYRIAVTSARRSEELCALLSRHGAEVFAAPAISMIALPDDDELHRNTESLIVHPPDILVAHNGIGFRGWVAAAEGWAAALDAEGVMLGVDPLNGEACAFYEAAGYPVSHQQRTKRLRRVVRFERPGEA